ncbi:hypothetical protein ACO0QE_001187 [Hanseniaspora vineae]
MSFRKVDFQQPKRTNLKDDLYSTSPYTEKNKFELPITPREEPALAPTQSVPDSLPSSSAIPKQKQQKTSGVSTQTIVAPDPQRSDVHGVSSDVSHSPVIQTGDITNSHNELFLQGRNTHNLQVPKISKSKNASDSRTNSLEGYGSDVEEEGDGEEEVQTQDDQWDDHPLTKVETIKLDDLAKEDAVNFDDISNAKSKQVSGDKLAQLDDKSNMEQNKNVKYNAPNSAMNAFFNTNASAVPVVQSADNHSNKKPAFFHSLKHSGLLPTFQKRPLSDTPVHSLMNSPNTNNTPNLSPLPSNIEMSGIDGKTDYINTNNAHMNAGDNHDDISSTQNNRHSECAITSHDSTNYTDTDYTSSGMDDSEADSFYTNNNTDNFNYTTGGTATDASYYSAHKELNDSNSSPNTMNNRFSLDNRNVSDRDPTADRSKRQRRSVARKHLKKPPLKKRTSSVMTTLDVPGLTKSKISPDGHIAQQDAGAKLVIVMVGLPATGKSFLTNKLSRYLNFSMYECRVFNVGNTRREYAAKHKDQVPEQDSKFFDPKNENSNHLREQWAMDTLDQLLDYLLDMHGNVAIFDATNTTKLRRNNVVNRIRERSKHLKIVFLESICSDEELVAKNIKLKLLGPDYKGKNSQQSLEDFENRLKQYRKAYQPVEDEEVEKYNVSYVKMIDVGKKVISYNIQGYLASQTIYYLLNFNLSDRQIWITRNGESEYNVLGKIGGDSKLTTRGLKYSQALAQFIRKKRKEFNYEMRLKNLNNCKRLKRAKDQLCRRKATTTIKHIIITTTTRTHTANQQAICITIATTITINQQQQQQQQQQHGGQQEESAEATNGVSPSRPAHEFHLPNFFVWTSMLKRSIETAQFFDEDEYPTKEMKMLNELSAGDFEGLTYQEIQQEYPEEFEERLHDKLLYRYPGIGGESYFDVINRLRTVITELERITDNVLLICHRVVARVLLGYFLNLSKEIYSNLDVPLHSVYCLETTPYGVTWKLFEYDEALNDFHEIPQDEINTKVVQQIGIVHQERRFSVVPTVGRKESDVKKLLDSNSSKEKLSHSGESPSERTTPWKNTPRPTLLSTNPFKSARNVPRSSIMNSQNANKSILMRRNDSESNIIKAQSQKQQEHHSNNDGDDTVMNSPKELTNSLSSTENVFRTKQQIMDTLETHQLEIEKLSEKLQNLKQNDESDQDS